MGNLSLHVHDLNLSYKNFSLSHISFKLNSGDILGLIGRSGSGKSTLIKALLGLKKPDSGNISFKVNGGDSPLNRYVGYSPQHNALYPFLTLEENLIIFGKLNGVESYTIEERMAFILERLNLKAHLRKRINELSGGMQKRADLAVTLIHNPMVIILDEPFNGVDISLQKFIWQLLKDMSGQGRIIIVSSHILQDIQKYCNQFGLMENNTYYHTEQVNEAINSHKEQSLETFLEKLFSSEHSKGN